MNFVKRLCSIVFMVIALAAGVFAVVAALDLVSPDSLTGLLSDISSNPQASIIVAIGGIVLALVGISAPFRLEKHLKKNKVITFQNADGGVAVSTLAIEEYIKKIAKYVPGIKSISSRVNLDRKGIAIVSSVTMSAGANIPETTELLQGEIRARVQKMLGQEEKINITIHISRILPGKGAEAEMMPENEEELPNIPFGE